MTTDVRFKQKLQNPRQQSVISNRQWWKEGTFLCVGVGGDQTHVVRPGGAGYARLCQPGNKKGLSFISNRQRQKEGTFCVSELAGIETTPPAPEEQGMPAFTN
jgi:hypothetical protein